MKVTIHDIQDTLFLKKEFDGLKQLVNISVNSSFSETVHGILVLNFIGQKTVWSLPNISPKQSTHRVFIPELAETGVMEVNLKINGTVMDRKEIMINPPKHWRIHVVQMSHHDLGYTGLPSNVLSKHARYLGKAIDMAEATESYPDEAKFRLTIEQAWSVDYFLKKASPERAEKLIKLMQSGQFELTALFGNMITELCGHESLIKTLYTSFRLKKKYGIPVISAEHNDITGISWGLCRLLTDMDIKIFCPGLPLYYNWSDPPYQSFWDEQVIFRSDENGIPGAFWWEAVTGKKILFWCNNKGCGGSPDPSFPGLIETLNKIENSNYPGAVLRWPVQGGARDNSPYVIAFAEAIKTWNENWAYPKLISSTNAGFYEEFSKADLSGLPVHRGELPGQDYPVGAISTARTVALNRNNHHSILSAEKLAVIAKSITDYKYQAYELEKAWKNTLYFEEHAWGHVFSHGPAMDGAEAEKAVYASRATAYAHDVKQKALAKIADNIYKNNDDIHLMVFNSLGFDRTNVIRVPMREIENSEVIMEEKNGILANSALQGRMERTHLILPEEFINGNFELLDTKNNKKVDFQLLKISAKDSETAYAAQRNGLAQGRKEYFNRCQGWDYDLCFIAEDVPALGYKTYRLQALSNEKTRADVLVKPETVIENEYYRITIDYDKNIISSIFDKKQQRELIDSEAPHAFGEIIVRSPSVDSIGTMISTERPEIRHEKIVSSITFHYSIHGHPVISQTILMYTGIKKIDFTVKILKDSTPLLDVHIAFPFAVHSPQFRYEGTLNVLEPIKDFLPGAYSDALTIQNWVEVKNNDYSLIWSSHDAPVATFGELWPGYVSPAHSCVIPKRMPHSPQQKDDFKHGWIYSNIFNNNFCTNFSVT
ncbi:MAG: hypothetical protein KAS17_07375, partial [Victivallaceae bacterium]|nr:hypothetical protein [Victivallaceae bacterium]